MTTPKSAAERKRTQRENMRKNGFVRVECWVHKEDVKLMKALELELKTKSLEENKMTTVKIDLSSEKAVISHIKHFVLLSSLNCSSPSNLLEKANNKKLQLDVSKKALENLQRAYVVLVSVSRYESNSNYTLVSEEEAILLGYEKGKDENIVETKTMLYSQSVNGEPLLFIKQKNGESESKFIERVELVISTHNDKYPFYQFIVFEQKYCKESKILILNFCTEEDEEGKGFSDFYPDNAMKMFGEIEVNVGGGHDKNWIDSKTAKIGFGMRKKARNLYLHRIYTDC